MRVQLLSETSPASHLVLRTVAIACLLASLMIGTAWPMSASGRAGIPQGATKLGTSGLSVSASVPGPNASSDTNPTGTP